MKESEAMAGVTEDGERRAALRADIKVWLEVHSCVAERDPLRSRIHGYVTVTWRWMESKRELIIEEMRVGPNIRKRTVNITPLEAKDSILWNSI
jgi:hypothetical protein